MAIMCCREDTGGGNALSAAPRLSAEVGVSDCSKNGALTTFTCRMPSEPLKASFGAKHAGPSLRGGPERYVLCAVAPPRPTRSSIAGRRWPVAFFLSLRTTSLKQRPTTSKDAALSKLLAWLKAKHLITRGVSGARGRNRVGSTFGFLGGRSTACNPTPRCSLPRSTFPTSSTTAPRLVLAAVADLARGFPATVSAVSVVVAPQC